MAGDRAPSGSGASGSAAQGGGGPRLQVAAGAAQAGALAAHPERDLFLSGGCPQSDVNFN